MTVNHLVSVLTGCSLALAAIAGPASAEPAEKAASGSIQFRLRHPEPGSPQAGTSEHDEAIWEDVNPAWIREAQEGLLESRHPVAQGEDPRSTLSGAVLSGLTLLPVVGQFANHEWMKGLLVLGTGIGLATGITLGNRRGNPQLVQLGTLGLYPLVGFSLIDAYGTAQHRNSQKTARSGD